MKWPWSRSETAKTETVKVVERLPTGSNKSVRGKVSESDGQVVKDMSVGEGAPEPHPENFGRYAQLSMDPEVDTAIMMRVAMEVGVGFQTEDAEAKESLPTKKKRVDDWNEKTNLDGQLRIINEARYRYGFCPVQLDPWLVLQPEFFWVHRDKYGVIQRYSERKDRYGSEITGWLPRDVAIFYRRWTPSRPYGLSIVEPIVRQLDTRNEVNEELPDVIANVAYPFRVFIGRTDAIRTKVEELVANRSKYENVFLGNMNMSPQDPDLVIHEVATDPRFNPTPMLEHMDFEINEGLMSPHLGQLKNATEASANALMTAIMLDVQSEQRYLKRVVEGELWKPVAGEPPPRLVWNTPAPRVKELTILELSSLLSGMVPNVIDVPEARTIIRAYLRLSDKEHPDKPRKDEQPPIPVKVPFGGGAEAPAQRSEGLEIVLSTIQEAYEMRQIDLRMALQEGRKAVESQIEEAKLNARKALKVSELSPESEDAYGIMLNEMFSSFRERLIPVYQKLPRET